MVEEISKLYGERDNTGRRSKKKIIFLQYMKSMRIDTIQAYDFIFEQLNHANIHRRDEKEWSKTRDSFRKTIENHPFPFYSYRLSTDNHNLPCGLIVRNREAVKRLWSFGYNNSNLNSIAYIIDKEYLVTILMEDKIPRMRIEYIAHNGDYIKIISTKGSIGISEIDELSKHTGHIYGFTEFKKLVPLDYMHPVNELHPLPEWGQLNEVSIPLVPRSYRAWLAAQDWEVSGGRHDGALHPIFDVPFELPADLEDGTITHDDDDDVPF